MAVLMLITLMMSGCQSPAMPNQSSEQAGSGITLQDLASADAIIAVESGTIAEKEILEALPNAKYLYVNSPTDGYLAVQTGKAQAYAGDQAIFASARRAGLKGLTALDETIGQAGKVAVGVSPVSPVPDLAQQINIFLAEMESEGVLADMYQRWVVDGTYNLPEIPPPSDPVRTVKIGTTGLLEPYTFYNGTELTGYEIEMMHRFAYWANVGFEIQTYDWGGIIPACATGKVDLIMSNLFDTDERDETILFSDPYIRVTTALIVPDAEVSPVSSTTLSDQTVVPVPVPGLPTLSELDGQSFAVVTGTLLDDYARTYFPQSEIISFNNAADMVTAVINQKAAACLMDEPVAQLVVQKNPRLAIVDELVLKDDYAYAAAKTEFGAMLSAQLSDFISQITTDGTLAELKAAWLGSDESVKVVGDWRNLPATHGIVHFVTVAQVEPFSYYQGTEIVGYDIDLLVRFCEAYGYGLEITDTAAGTWMAGLAGGKYDLAAAAISVTAERSQSVHFSTPNYNGGIVAVVAAPAGETPVGQAQSTLQGSSPSPSARFQTLTDFSGSVVGTLTGTVFDQILSGYMPDLSFQYFDDISSVVLALQSGRVDVVGLDEPIARLVTSQMAELTIFPQPLETDQYGFALAKNSQLTDQISALIEEFSADGTLESLQAKWFGADESQKSIAVKPADNPSGTLRYAHDPTLAPMAYIGQAGQSLGYEVELAALFAQRLGLRLEITPSNFSSLLSLISSSKADLVSGAMSITDERRQSVDFPASHYTGGIVLLVRKSDLAGDPSGVVNASNSNSQSQDPSGVSGLETTSAEGFWHAPWQQLSSSFYKNFVTENRWQLILSGIGMTLLISLLSALVGTVFGFGVCLLRLSRRRTMASLAKAFIRLIQGIPLVVLLMMLYYVVFGSVDISAVLVAVIGIAINFGVYVSEMMRTGIEAVDKGQIEAALALGYSRVQTFRKITFPQAARHFLPVYKGEFISMVKMTSIVGYIAIQDLTKVTDIIRSRTYEAFFPLVITAAIYFLLAFSLTALLDLAEIQVDPRRRSRKVKGVQETSKEVQS